MIRVLNGSDAYIYFLVLNEQLFREGAARGQPLLLSDQQNVYTCFARIFIQYPF